MVLFILAPDYYKPMVIIFMNKLLSLFSLLLILSFSTFGTTVFAASHEKAAEEKVAVDADGNPIKKKKEGEAEEEEPDCD